MKVTVLSEDTFSQQITAEVLPFLETHRQSGYYEPDGRGQIYYERYVSPAAAGIVLLLHGFTESAAKYTELIYYFLRAGYTVYIADLRGHGRSARETDDPSMVHIESYEDYLTDAAQLAAIAKKEYPLLPLYLYGHSMGGGIAAAMLERYPPLFAKAVLSSPMIRPLTGGVPFHPARAVARLMTAFGKGKTYVAGQHAYSGNETFEDSAATSPARYRLYADRRRTEPLLQTSGASYAWLKEAAALSIDILKPAHCRRIQTKTLLFQAENEAFVDTAAQARFAAQSAMVELAPVPHTKHEIFMSGDDVMQAYITRILAFFSN